MSLPLKEINKATLDTGGVLGPIAAEVYRRRYRALLEEADKECPAPDESQRKKGRRGRLARSMENFLETLLCTTHQIIRD